MTTGVPLICGSLQAVSSNRAALDVVRTKLGDLPGVSTEDAVEVGVIATGATGGVYVRQQSIRSMTCQEAHVVAELGIGTPRAKSD
jgi:hypothetical protein